MKTLRVHWCPGMTVREAVAKAWARLELQGYVILDEPAPTVVTERDSAGRVFAWTIAFPVVEPGDPS